MTAMNLYMNDLATREISIATRKKYRQLFDRLTDWTADRGLAMLHQLNVPAMRDFRASWTSVSAVSANKMLERLRSFFRFCAESKWIDSNPAAAVRRAKETHAPTMPFTADEVERIMQTAYDRCEGRSGESLYWAARARALLLVLRWSALRISDAVSLEVGHVEGDTILIGQAKTRVTIRVPVPHEVIAALEAIRRPDQPLFFGGAGGKLETRTGDWRRLLRTIFAEAEVPDAHPHRFRDTRAVELLLAGVPIERVAALLGHASIRVTERHYAPWVKERQDQLEADIRRTFQPRPVAKKKVG